MTSVNAPRPDHSSDCALVARVRAGDRHAFAEIHARYRRPLLVFVTRLLGSRAQDAEDVVQDSFLRTYRVLTADDRELELGAWLYRVAHNRAIDELRRPIRTVSVDSETAQIASFDGDPLAATCSREELGAVVADLKGLPARQRVALISQAVEGDSHETLACRLGITVGGSKNLVTRARGSLLRARRERARNPTDPLRRSHEAFPA